MGGSSSKPAADSDGGASNRLEVQLIEQQVAELFTFKILLLGAGESGKSTIVKQMKIIHRKKIDDKEREQVGTSLHQNTVDCMKALINASHTFGLELTEEDQATEKMIEEHVESDRLTYEQGEAILKLWKSETIQQTYARRSEFWLLDSFSYYIKNLERFCEDDFVPTDEDVVMARIRTTGIVVTELEQRIAKEHDDEPEKLMFQVVDVGGQRNERKKWMHCFDDVRAILFCVNLAGYDQVLFEDSSKNRMQESLELFQQVSNNKTFKDTPIFLFLNKKDLFESMCLETNIKKVFPEYDGPAELMPSLEFIENLFRQRLPEGKDVSIQVVSANYRRDIRSAFEDVKKALYDINRKALLAKVAKLNRDKSKLASESGKGGSGGGCC